MIQKLLNVVVAFTFFILGMTLAYYKQFMADPPEHYAIPVSYTHLTLPTKRIV